MGMPGRGSKGYCTAIDTSVVLVASPFRDKVEFKFPYALSNVTKVRLEYLMLGPPCY